jgi:4-hydroxybenzoyl-CoA thioesterase
MRIARQTLRIMFADCDPAQIVFYPTYIQWFDRATQNLFNEAGLPWSTFFPGSGIVGLPVVDVQASFKGPARMDETVEMESWIEEWRGRTFVVGHRVKKDGKAIVEGREIRAWTVRDETAPTGIKAAAIPDAVKAKFDE